MKRFFSLVVMVTLVATAVLSGCGKDTSTGSGNSVVVGISQDLDSLDPHNAAYAGTREVLFNLYEGLVKPVSSGAIEPAVASDFEVAEDAKSILFTLRDGVKYWDGTAVTVDDVIFSINRYADIQGSESAFSVLKSVEAQGDNQILVTLSKANSEFIYQLTCAIIPASYDETTEDCPLGTGPFKYVSYTAGESLEVERNENYWKENCPYLDAVTFKIVTDADTAILQLNSGTLDIYQYLTSDQAETLDSEKFNIQVGNVNYVQGMFLNNAVEPFNDVRVRQALYYAVDRQEISDILFDGQSHIIGTHLIPAMSAYYDESLETAYTRDLDKAKELLKEAGYEDGFEFTITVPNNYAPHEGTAQVIVENLAEVGIKANIELVEFTTWYSDVYLDRNYEATVVAVDGTLAPSSWFSKNVSTDSNNFTNYNNAEFDKVYEAALAETDLDAKVDYYKQLQKILSDDAASIYCQDPSNLLAINSKLTGYEFYPVSAQDMSIVKYAE